MRRSALTFAALLLSSTAYAQINNLPNGAATFPRAIDNTLYCSRFASLQACHDALPANGGKIILPNNTTYVLTSLLTISKPNVIFECPGWSTIIQRGAALSGDMVDFTGIGDIVKDCAFDGNGGANITGQSEVSLSAANQLAQHIQVQNSASVINVALSGVNGRITASTITGMGTLLSTQRGYGVWANNHVKVTIDYNVISNTGIDGIGFDGNGSQVIGNRVSGAHTYTGGSGGQIVCYGGGSNVAVGANISNNSVFTGGSTFASGLEIDCANSNVTNNSLDTIQGSAINVAGNGTNIVGNWIRNSPTASFSDSISVAANVTNFQIVGNRIFDDQGSTTIREAIRVNSGTSDNYIIADNFGVPNGQAAIVDQGTGLNKIITHNLGMDNIIPSVASAAAFPISTVNSAISITGTTGVTSITGGFWTGRVVTLIPVGIVAFTAGNNIANSFTTVAGVPVILTYDGTLWHLK